MTNEVYYGSTTYKYLSSRLAKHKNSRSCSAIKIIDRGNFNIKVLEEFPCKSKQELETRERWYIENNHCINNKLPIFSEEERSKKYREYYEKHNEHLKAMMKAYASTKVKCECGCVVRRGYLSKHRKTKKHLDLLTSNAWE